MKVCKFGGSSLANAAQLNKVIDIVLADPARRIVVVSAPGKRHGGDTKVTDLLIALAKGFTRHCFVSTSDFRPVPPPPRLLAVL